jgi:hypothetical protein
MSFDSLGSMVMIHHLVIGQNRHRIKIFKKWYAFEVECCPAFSSRTPSVCTAEFVSDSLEYFLSCHNYYSSCFPSRPSTENLCFLFRSLIM